MNFRPLEYLGYDIWKHDTKFRLTFSAMSLISNSPTCNQEIMKKLDLHTTSTKSNDPPTGFRQDIYRSNGNSIL